MRRVLALSAAALVLGSAAHAQEVFETTQADFRVATVAEGLEFPWGIAFLPDGAMLVSEREGRLRYVDENGLRDTVISGLPEDLVVERQGGLLDCIPSQADHLSPQPRASSPARRHQSWPRHRVP